MMENQKEIIERILKLKNKKKRELAAYLGITENSINRMLRNNNIGLARLQNIAKFLEVDFFDILPQKALIDANETHYFHSNALVINENIVEKLSDALLAGNRTNESQSKTIESLLRILEDKLKNGHS
jgi:Helix-turn-helix.